MDKVVEIEVLTKQVAAALIGGATQAEAAKQLAIPVSTVKRIAATPEFKELLAKVGDEELAPVLAATKTKLAKLANTAIRVVEYHLKENNLEAAKMVLKAIGLEKPEEQRASDTTLTVVLPGSPEAAAIEVKSEQA